MTTTRMSHEEITAQRNDFLITLMRVLYQQGPITITQATVDECNLESLRLIVERDDAAGEIIISVKERLNA